MPHANEQVGKYTGPGARRWAKRARARWARRLAKRDPENAPRRAAFRGWTD